MKKLLTAALVAMSMVAYGQIKIADIKGDYCEFTKISMLGREAIVVYHQNEMAKLLNDDGTDVKPNKTGSLVSIFCLFAEKGWTLKLKYEDNRSSVNSTIFLMERRK